MFMVSMKKTRGQVGYRASAQPRCTLKLTLHRGLRGGLSRTVIRRFARATRPRSPSCQALPHAAGTWSRIKILLDPPGPITALLHH